jgi:hypothetical protein
MLYISGAVNIAVVGWSERWFGLVAWWERGGTRRRSRPQRRPALWVRTASASARWLPTSTTSRVARVMAV